MAMNDNRVPGPLTLKGVHLISPFDYARLHGVHVNTVYDWIRKGYLHPLPYYAQTQRRFQLRSDEPCPHPAIGRNAAAGNREQWCTDWNPHSPAKHQKPKKKQ